MKKPLILAIAGVIVVALLAGIGYAWQRHEDKKNGPLQLHGNVDIRQVSLAFDGSGRVAELNAQEGDLVKAGAVLARLDTATLKLQADRARADVEGQQQRLLRLRHGSTPEELAEARSRLAAAQADADRAGQDLSRLQDIAKATNSRGVAKQDIDRASSALQVARAKVNELAQALRALEVGPRREDIGAADAQVKSAQAQLALLQHQIDQAELRAPADGIVRSRLVEPGDMASPQRPVFALALAGPKWVRVYLSEPDLGRVHTGMAANVRTDGQPGQAVQGTVAFISPVAEFTPKSVQTEELRTSLVYEVRVRVDDASNQLRMGQPATVELDVAPAAKR
ncbi:MAG TPA: HlyD family efflux transporter periplasmic adaptor subunit [Burkholderiaceae bacterium]|jgi:HlyD family secretion protein